jgi:SAM-dependent methyltransferase
MNARTVHQRYYGALCSEMYDLTKPVGRHYPDVPYYLNRLAAIGGPLLEAAVGTGRLLVPLLRAGLQIEGIDNSTDMLARCYRNCKAAGLHPTLHCGALETMDLPNHYNAIVISFGSFMLLSGPGEATAALDRMRRHLVPDGRLFLDVDAPRSPAAWHEDRELRRAVHCPDGSTIVLVNVRTSDDVADRIEHRVLSYEKWKDGRSVARETQDFSLRLYEHDEVSALLTEAGFVNIDVCADYVEGAAAGTAKDWLCFSGAKRAPSTTRHLYG